MIKISFALDCGMKTFFKIPAGEKMKYPKFLARPNHIFLEPEKGESYYFGADCNGWVCWFEELSRKLQNNGKNL